MCHEIAEHVRAVPGDATLHLLLGGRLHPAALLDTLPAAGSPVPPSRAAAWRRYVARLPLARPARDQLNRLRLDRTAARLGRGGPVVYHEPNVIVTPFDGPTVTTVNDLSWIHHPHTHPDERLAWIERGLPRTLRQATRVVTISRFTAGQVAHELGVPPERIDVVPLAPSARFRPVGPEAAAPALARYGLADRSYVLSVSTLEPRKNFDGLFAAWRSLPAREQDRFPLVIAGGKGWGRVLADAEAERARAAGRLRLLGHVPDEDLTALYARCAAFAYLSLYEGFGLPIVEAMAAGAPVITSATTACAETAGDAARLVDPAHPAEAADALRALLGDPAEAQRWRDRGRTRAAHFTWPRTVERLFESWRRASLAP